MGQGRGGRGGGGGELRSMLLSLPEGAPGDDKGMVWSLDDQYVAKKSGGGQNVSTNELADVKMLEIIGCGAYGAVYKAFWRGRLVAVKVLEHGQEMVGGSSAQEVKDANSRRAALLEGAMTSTLDHPNVVQTFDFRVVNLQAGMGSGRR
jgi:hypothetical protein